MRYLCLSHDQRYGVLRFPREISGTTPTCKHDGFGHKPPALSRQMCLRVALRNTSSEPRFLSSIRSVSRVTATESCVKTASKSHRVDSFGSQLWRSVQIVPTVASCTRRSRVTSPLGWRQGEVSNFHSIGQPHAEIENGHQKNFPKSTQHRPS